MSPSKGPKIDPKATLRAEIAALPAKKNGTRPDAVALGADVLRPAYPLIVEAARARRMSVQAYVRRAALAFATHDLEIPFQAALDRDARVTRETGFALIDADGSRFGPWEIESLRGEAPK